MIDRDNLVKEYMMAIENRQRALLEKSSLPKGSIQRKIINNCTYYYLQYYEDGHVLSRYIHKETADTLKAQIDQRKRLDKYLKELRSSMHLMESALGKKEIERCYTSFIKEKVELVAPSYPVKRILLFGSRANGKFKSNSDVDLLADFGSERISLIKFSEMRNRFEEELGMSVDLVKYPLPNDSVLDIGKVVELYAV